MGINDQTCKARREVHKDVSPRVLTGNMQVEDTQDCMEMFFRMDKATLRQGILDCNATSCDCVDDTQEVSKWGYLWQQYSAVQQ